MSTRRISSVCHVGNIAIGGDNPIRIQSMGTVDTNDTDGCVAQAKRIIDAGGELVRFTTQGRREAENMRRSKEELQRLRAAKRRNREARLRRWKDHTITAPKLIRVCSKYAAKIRRMRPLKRKNMV